VDAVQKRPQDFGYGVSIPPLPPEAKKILKFDYEMVHSEVYLNKYVVSIAPFSSPHIQKTGLFLHGFAFYFFIDFSRGSADPICPYVRTPMMLFLRSIH